MSPKSFYLIVEEPETLWAYFIIVVSNRFPTKGHIKFYTKYLMKKEKGKCNIFFITSNDFLKDQIKKKNKESILRNMISSSALNKKIKGEDSFFYYMCSK